MGMAGLALTGVIHVLSTWEGASPGYCHSIHHGLTLNLVDKWMPFLSLSPSIKLSLTPFFSLFFSFSVLLFVTASKVTVQRTSSSQVK